MPNNIETATEISELDDSDEYGEGDFGFILGPDGELKSVMLPKSLMEDPPEEVLLILGLFGIDDIHELGNRTLH
jgi:hypothetical protein